MNRIALLDCNNFFVSCERLFRPDLQKRPVVVLSSNDGCVVARSNEIKDMGIPMGVPYFQIKDILTKAEAVIFSSHFALYRDVSRRVFEIVKSEFDVVEQYSIDECFISLNSDNPEADMLRLKERVEKEVGIPVSIGVAVSKTQAKYASKRAKKTNGICLLTEEAFSDLAPAIKLGEVWGVGQGRVAQFSKDKVETVADFVLLPKAVVENRYGIEGVRLQSELSGKPIYLVERKSVKQKSIMSTRSFSDVSMDKEVVRDAILYHLHQVVTDLAAMSLEAGALKVIIAPSRYSGYVSVLTGKQVILGAATADLFVLEKVAMDLFEEVFRADVPYKKAGIVLSQLVEREAKTASLFAKDDDRELKTGLVTKTIMELNKSLGANLLQLGRLPDKVAVWKSKQATLSPAYTTNWENLKVVKSVNKTKRKDSCS